MKIKMNSIESSTYAFDSGINNAMFALEQREISKAKNIVPLKRETLLAEGDSWFDYPGKDILSDLEDRYGYDVEDVANKGDTVEEMAYSGNQLDKFIRKLEKLIRKDETPKAILLSGGGNDITGETFSRLLNRADSPAPGLNPIILDEIVNGVVKNSYIHILSSITQVCKIKTGNPIPILTHSYDYAVADGRGYDVIGIPVAGPWLEPGFIEKGYSDQVQRNKIVTELISEFQNMLSEISNLPEFGHVKHVDLTTTLSNGPDYKKWWDNELHPTEEGFIHVTDKIASVIDSI